jgi:DNA-binding response OmpR family regulator
VGATEIGEAEIRALVVDDEKEVADAYALRLEGVCETSTVYGGAAALEYIEEHAVDVLLLDRHMPAMSGDEVLRELDDCGFDGRVIMVTAVDPGFEVLEMPFDDYLCKPVDRADLHAAIDQQRRVLAYETLGEYFSAESKRAVLEAELPPEERAERTEFEAVERRVERLERRAKRLLGPDTEVLEAFDDIDRENG